MEHAVSFFSLWFTAMLLVVLWPSSPHPNQENISILHSGTLWTAFRDQPCVLSTIPVNFQFIAELHTYVKYICKIHSYFLCMYIEVCDVVIFSFVEENIDTPFLLIYAVVNWNAIMFVDREAPSLQKYRNLITLVFTRILRQLIIYFSHKKFL